LSKARESAAAIACLSNHKQIGMALAMYAGDNGGWCAQDEGDAAPWIRWTTRMIPDYLPEGDPAGTSRVLQCPRGLTLTQSFHSCVGLNRYLSGRNVAPATVPRARLTVVVTPVETMLAMDSFNLWRVMGTWEMDPANLCLTGEDRAICRHDNTAIVLYCDSHADKVTPSFLAGQTNSALVFWNPTQ
jgi:prepilin-type processing-associated H-X9-DG protein